MHSVIWQTMLISTTFLLVLTAAFSFGILVGYAVIVGILHLFARSRRNAEPPPAISTQYPVLSTQKN